MKRFYILIILVPLALLAVIDIVLIIKHHKPKTNNPDTFTQPQKMCIFDVDNTMTHAANAENTGVCPNTQFLDIDPPNWPKGGGTTQTVKDSFAKCKQLGYGIAIATAETGQEFQAPEQAVFLSNLDPELNQDFINSPNLQYGCKIITAKDANGNLDCSSNEFTDKTAMYLNIMNYNNIPPSQWGNSIVFDDDMKNLTTAKGLGFKVCQASPQCGGVYCDTGCGIPEHCLDAIV